MNEKVGVIICDAGPIIHLHELSCLTLLNDFDQILVPEQVWQEVEHHRPDALRAADVLLQKVKVAISELPTFQAIVKSLSLDYGEQAAFSLMRVHPDALLLTDDAAARLAAVTLGYRVHGSIGILIRAIRRQQKTQAEVLEILRGLPSLSTLYIRPGLLTEIIAQIENITE